MKLYQLLWVLLKHALHGRIRDEVFLSVDWDSPNRYGGATGPVTGFTWESDRDAFCMIEATSQEDPYSDSLLDEDLERADRDILDALDQVVDTEAGLRRAKGEA